jgi:hypothetical protein
MKKHQRGLFIVEFAIAASALFIVLYAVIELARVMFIWNTGVEATRRGARVAAVCPIGHPAVADVTVFDDPNAPVGTSPILRGLTPADVTVAYLDIDGTPGETVFGDIRFVRVAINNYLVDPLIPFVDTTFTLPPFTTTIPSESLGFIPDPDNPGAAPVCSCYNNPSPCQP